VNAARAGSLRGTAVAGVAGIAEFMRSADPAATVAALRRALAEE
jgi:thiamine monophosphate synthase